jgi:glutaredoxin 3
MRCARHGLALAPDGKCVRCRREDAGADGERLSLPSAAAGPAARAGVVAALLVVLAGCIALAAYAWRTDHPSQGAGARGGAPVVTESPVPRPLPPAMAPLEPLIHAATAPPEPRRPPEEQRDEREAARLDAAMHRVPVTLYGTAWDPGCKRARAWLMDRGYAFTDRDVDADPSASRARAALTASRVVPLLDVDGQVLAGFDEGRTTHALEYAAARRLQR